jgi:taurine dioxygenase
MMHLALTDFDQTKTRHMIRTSILGELSGYYIDEGTEVEKESMLQTIASVS